MIRFLVSVRPVLTFRLRRFRNKRKELCFRSAIPKWNRQDESSVILLVFVLLLGDKALKPELLSCVSLSIRYNHCMAITRRQKEVIDFLSTFTQKNGYSPSYEEIASGLGLNSLATVHKHITNLQNKGLLQRAHNRSRSIDVLPSRASKKGAERLPLLGRIAAGRPVEAIESAESISLGDIIGNREVFALEVRGDSMRDEHIVSGDYVLVERTRTAREGEIIVALIDGSDATLKRFYREGAMVRLQPSNAEMSPIYAPAANVTIQGKVLGMLRKYA